MGTLTLENLRDAYEAGVLNGIKPIEDAMDFDTWWDQYQTPKDYPWPPHPVSYWERVYLVRLIDPKGWREDDKNLLDPVTEDEFVYRMNRSAVELLPGHTFYSDLMEQEQQGIRL